MPFDDTDEIWGHVPKEQITVAFTRGAAVNKELEDCPHVMKVAKKEEGQLKGRGVFYHLFGGGRWAKTDRPSIIQLWEDEAEYAGKPIEDTLPLGGEAVDEKEVEVAVAAVDDGPRLSKREKRMQSAEAALVVAGDKIRVKVSVRVTIETLSDDF